jgi:hypothetical protein
VVWVHFGNCLINNRQLFSENTNRLTKALIIHNNYINLLTRTWLRSRPARELPRAPTYKRHYDAAGIIGIMVLVYTGFHTRKNFYENYPQFSESAFQNFRRPCPRPKKPQIISLRGTPTYLWLALILTGWISRYAYIEAACDIKCNFSCCYKGYFSKSYSWRHTQESERVRALVLCRLLLYFPRKSLLPPLTAVWFLYLFLGRLIFCRNAVVYSCRSSVFLQRTKQFISPSLSLSPFLLLTFFL